MNVLDSLVSNTQQCSENKKEYPKEVDQNDKIGKNLVEHPLQLSRNMPAFNVIFSHLDNRPSLHNTNVIL